MYIGVRLRARGLSGASLTVRKWQLRCLSSWWMREPKRLGGDDGAAEEMFRRDQVKRQRLPGSYRDPHPSISDTSMWDKSIMCLCSNCKGFTDAVGVTTRLHPIPGLLRAMVTCGSSSGSLQRARDWRIWRRLSSAGGTWRTSVAEKTTGGGSMRQQRALEDHIELKALLAVSCGCAGISSLPLWDRWT